MKLFKQIGVQAFSVCLLPLFFPLPHKNQTLLSHFIASPKRLSVAPELTTSRILRSHWSLDPNYFALKNMKDTDPICPQSYTDTA